MSDVLEVLISKKRKRTKSTRDEWRKLIRDIGDGKAVKPERAEAVIAAAERSPEALIEAVKVYKQRKAWAAVVAESGETEARREQLNAEIKLHRQKLDKAEEDYANATSPILAEIEGMREIRREAGVAKTELIRTFDDDELLADIYAATAKVTEIDRRERSIQDRIHRLQSMMTTYNQQDMRGSERKTLIAEVAGKLDDAKKELEAAITEKAAAVRAEADAQLLKLIP